MKNAIKFQVISRGTYFDITLNSDACKKSKPLDTLENVIEYYKSVFEIATIKEGSLLIDVIELSYQSFINKPGYAIFKKIVQSEIEYNEIRAVYSEAAHFCFDDEIPEYKLLEKGNLYQRYIFFMYFCNHKISEKTNIKLYAFPNAIINHGGSESTILSPASIPMKNYKNISFNTNGFVDSILTSSNINFTESYICNSMYDLLYLELMKVVKGNLKINKCKCCLNYFIPSGRIDTDYCDRIAPNSSRTCKEIGAAKVYAKSRKNNPVYEIFSKEYKKRNAWARLKRVVNGKPYTNEDFYIWSDEARKMRDKTLKGEVEFEDFKTFLLNN